MKEIKESILWKSKENRQLVEALLSLENASEAEAFLRDLMTTGEIEEFGKRLEAARLLSKDFQYNAIIESTGLSSTTIARISKWLKGSLGGYRLILSRLSTRQSSGQIFTKNSHHNNLSKLKKGLILK